MRRRGDAGEDPVPVRDALREVRAQLGVPDAGAIEVLSRHWPDVVGADMASHARIGAVRDGVLTVVVDAPPWATRLRFAERDLLARVAGVLGADVVRSVRVRVQPPP